MRNMVGIVNFKAGKGEAAAIAEKARARFRTSGIQLDLHETRYPGHATEIAKKYISEGSKEFICMGGDGTLYETINGLCVNGIKPDIRLGIIPVGTGNSFLKDFNQHTMNLADKIIQNKTRYCDIIETQHTKGKLFWINIFSFGFTANVGATRNEKFPNAGTIGYSFSVFLELKELSSTHFSMKLDGAPLETDATFISINNTRFTGGNMMMAPNAKPDDGLVDVIEVQKMTRMELLRAFPKIFKGTHTSLSNVKSHKAKSIEFNFTQPLDVMIDGEMKNIQPLSMQVLPKAIQIYA